MRLTKQEREAVRAKFDGRCAYCGEDLPKVWHADHLEPVHRTDWIKVDGEPLCPENHRIENMMPACPRCNISKGGMSLEMWRGWIARHVESLNKHHPIYRVVKSFGLVVETARPVMFHFEAAKSRETE